MQIIFLILTGFSLLFSIILILHLFSALAEVKAFNKKNLVTKGTKEKISIVIPAANEEIVIKGCLQSIFTNNQAYIYEVIVVISNSNDNTQKIILDFAKKYTNLRLIREKAGDGKKAALLRGLSEVKTPLALLIDADIVFNGNGIKELVDFHVSIGS